MTSLAYVDASALTKLILAEPESGAMLRWYVESNRVTCSVVGIIETRRAVRRHEHDASHLELILRSIVVLDLDADLAMRAAAAQPVTLRTLDAVHLAAAQLLGSDIDAFVTYDQRLADAARAAGLPVVVPAA
jgi:predicted nucleic acid-binding protein